MHLYFLFYYTTHSKGHLEYVTSVVPTLFVHLDSVQKLLMNHHWIMNCENIQTQSSLSNEWMRPTFNNLVNMLIRYIFKNRPRLTLSCVRGTDINTGLFCLVAVFWCGWSWFRGDAVLTHPSPAGLCLRGPPGPLRWAHLYGAAGPKAEPLGSLEASLASQDRPARSAF